MRCIPPKGAINIIYVFEKPHKINNINIRGSRYKRRNIFNNSITFIGHSFLLIWIVKRDAYEIWDVDKNEISMKFNWVMGLVIPNFAQVVIG